MEMQMRKRPTLGRALAAGLGAGATTGLLAAVLSAPLRRLAGVSDRALINGASAVGLAIGFWLLGSVLYWAIAGRARRPALIVGVVAAIIGVLVAAAIYADAGPAPLAPYPVRFASLAVPLIAVVVIGGALLLPWLVHQPLPGLRAGVAGALLAALIAGGLVYALDRKGSVHYTLTTAGREVSSKNDTLPTPAAVAGGTAVASGTPTAGGAAATATPAASALHFVVAQGSEVSYTVREQLARLPGPSDAIGKTQTISGDIWLTPTGLDPAHVSTITVDLRTLTSDAPQRDRYLLNNSLQSNAYPYATYTITNIDGFPTNYKPGTPVQVTLHGNFTVHGQTKPLDWTGMATYDGKQIEVVMSTQFDMNDFGITPPNVPVARAESGVRLDAHIYATQQAG
jgi:polyisoprenoid-binding protein YceI